MEPAEIREEFARQLGPERFEEFSTQLRINLRKRPKLNYWHEQEWRKFCNAHALLDVATKVDGQEAHLSTRSWKNMVPPANIPLFSKAALRPSYFWPKWSNTKPRKPSATSPQSVSITTEIQFSER